MLMIFALSAAVSSLQTHKKFLRHVYYYTSKCEPANPTCLTDTRPVLASCETDSFEVQEVIEPLITLSCFPVSLATTPLKGTHRLHFTFIY